MESLAVRAQVRNQKKKSAAKALRRAGKIPGIIYGPEQTPTPISIDQKTVLNLLKKEHYKGIMIDLTLESAQQEAPKKCLVKEIQWDPIKRQPLHVDLYAVSKDHEITVEIPITFINTPIGATKGGIFEPILRELTVSCLIERMIDSIEVDVSNLDIGDSLHVKDLKLPEGIKVRVSGDEVVAVISPPPQEGSAEASKGEAG